MVIVYGGKDERRRLGDIFSLDTGTNTWTELKPLGFPPLNRSLHSAVMISETKMVVLGGLVQRSEKFDQLMDNHCPTGKQIWQADDSVRILDLAADEWLDKGLQGDQQDKLSFGRYGLQAALVGSRIYIFAGKKNYKECVNDLVFLETKTPIRPVNLRLMKGMETEIHVAWSSIKTAEKYLVQCSPVDPKKAEKKAENSEAKSDKEDKERKDEEAEKKAEGEKVPSDKIQWHDVQILKHTGVGPTVSCEIQYYYQEAAEGETLSEDEKAFLDAEKKWKKTKLTPGVTYRVRVCAINSCGRSQFSEYGSYKTSTPGFPGAPWNIKVSKTDLGASLAWQPPANADVIEYSVYLSVKKEYTTGQSGGPPTGKSNFTRVYIGHDAACIVSHALLAQAATSTSDSNKAAVIFRIAAKNKKGYGPATQVRWIQDAKIKRPAGGAKNSDAKKAK